MMMQESRGQGREQETELCSIVRSEWAGVSNGRLHRRRLRLAEQGSPGEEVVCLQTSRSVVKLLYCLILSTSVGWLPANQVPYHALSEAHKMTVTTVIAGQVKHIRTTVEQPVVNGDRGVCGKPAWRKVFFLFFSFSFNAWKLKRATCVFLAVRAS